MKNLYPDIQINGADIDTVVHCSCGHSFYVYLPDTDYQCPNPFCEKLYRTEIRVYEINKEDLEDNYVLIGHAYNGT